MLFGIPSAHEGDSYGLLSVSTISSARSLAVVTVNSESNPYQPKEFLVALEVEY